MKVNFMPLGPDCNASGWLIKLNLRNESLPFDFLLTEPTYKGINYVTNVIDKDFTNYLENLTYNHQNKVISKNYPNTKFWHHDLITNKQKIVKSIKIDHLNMEEPLIEKFKRRGKRFLNNMKNDNTIFLFYINYTDFMYNKNDILNDINKFFNVIDKKTSKKYSLCVILYVNTDIVENNYLNLLNNIDNKLFFCQFVGGEGSEEINKNALTSTFDKIKQTFV